MKSEKRHIALLVGVNLCRFLLAAIFIFSGFVKAIDPKGLLYKLEEYQAAFSILAWIPHYMLLCAAVTLPMLEFCIGIYLLLGIRRRFASIMAFLLMVIMTPLTFYLALTNPVADCGCFGDAWVLTNWQTFGKNVVLLAASVVVIKKWHSIFRFITLKLEWMASLYTLLYILILTFYCYSSLPILDFRPYRIGVNIQAGMEIPAGAKPSVFESRFVLEKGGKQAEFTLENYPDSTWKFVETRTVLKEKGYEPPIHDFSIVSMETGEDLTDSILSPPGYTFLLVMNQLNETDESEIDLINEIYDYSVENEYGFYALTASSEEEVLQWRDLTGAEYPFCQTDNTTLKTIIRSNPGLLLLRGGTILNKWGGNDLPDEYVLNDRLEKIELGKQKPVSDSRTIGYALLWFVLPLIPVLGADILVIKRRERKAAKAQAEQAEKNHRQEQEKQL